MPLTFINGGSPTYPGEIFTSITELMTKIKNLLTNGGWTITVDNIPTELRARGNADNGDFCYFRFTNPATGTLRINGLLDNSVLTADVSVNFDLLFSNGNNNKIYGCADHDSFHLLVLTNVGISYQCSGGFLDRYTLSDTYGWFIGDLNYTYNNKYWAKALKDGSKWRRAGDDFTSADAMGTAGNCTPYQGVFDLFTVSLNKGTHYDTVTTTNLAYKAYEGQVNGVDGKPVLGPYFFLEGDKADRTYSTIPPTLRFRGTVKNAVTGLASFLQGVEITTPTGQVYISGGAKGFQGFRIV